MDNSRHRQQHKVIRRVMRRLELKMHRTLTEMQEADPECDDTRALPLRIIDETLKKYRRY